MEISNRLNDVNKLSCNICQDFLKMVVNDDWQEKLYNKAKNEVNSGKRKNKYINTYSKMRDIRIENFSIDDMDITIIAEIVYGWRDFVNVNKNTRDAILQIANDRNKCDHLNENESKDELYRIGLKTLYDLKDFINTVDTYEISINDKLRIEYKSRYNAKIGQLIELLDEERVKYVQQDKEIKNDVIKVLER